MDRNTPLVRVMYTAIHHIPINGMTKFSSDMPVHRISPENLILTHSYKLDS